MKALLVDDNARVARFVCKGLREGGRAAGHVDNGRRAGLSTDNRCTGR